MKDSAHSLHPATFMSRATGRKEHLVLLHPLRLVERKKTGDRRLGLPPAEKAADFYGRYTKPAVMKRSLSFNPTPGVLSKRSSMAIRRFTMEFMAASTAIPALSR